MAVIFYKYNERTFKMQINFYLCKKQFNTIIKTMDTNHFDQVAKTWDENPIHKDRTLAIAAQLENRTEFREGMTALEFGSGTGLLSFALKDRLTEIIMMDNSVEMNRQALMKTEASGTSHLKPVLFNLESEDYKEGTFDMIFTQMAMHHVVDINALLIKFHALLNEGGTLAIADLYTEDGTFHDRSFDGHFGFDPETLIEQVKKAGFINPVLEPCFEIRRVDENQTEKVFPIFLLTAKKK